MEEKLKIKQEIPYSSPTYTSNIDEILRKYEHRATPETNKPVYPQVQKEFLEYQAPADTKLKEEFYGDGYKVS